MAPFDEVPTFADLMLPTLQAVEAKGGTATSSEITTWIVDTLGFTEEQLAGAPPDGHSRDKQVAIDRCGWARSACKLGGSLKSPRPELFLLTDLGKQILGMPEGKAYELLRRSVRRGRHDSQSLRFGRRGQVA